MINTPDVGDLDEAVRALQAWQVDEAPVPLHPGDLGWHWRFGAETTAAAVRTWSHGGGIVAVGLLDGPGLVRLAVAPAAQDDVELAAQLVDDLTRPEAGVLPAGDGAIEIRSADLLRSRLLGAGWVLDESWTPLRRDLTEPVADAGLRIAVIDAEDADAWAAVLRASFEGSTFGTDRWHAMAGGTPYAGARCLLGYDEQDVAVAVATVWSAGPGRPGLLEPVGVHRDHRGHRYGTAISVAAAAALRDLGSSSATVCTPSSNVAAVATYRSAGFDELPVVRDLRRPGT